MPKAKNSVHKLDIPWAISSNDYNMIPSSPNNGLHLCEGHMVLCGHWQKLNSKPGQDFLWESDVH